MPISLPTGVRKSGQNLIFGDVQLAEGSNVTLTQSGNVITIASTGGGGTGTNLQNSSGSANHPYAAFFGPCLRNLVANPRFENNVTDSWSTSGLVSVARQTASPFVGSGFARITFGGVGTGTVDRFWTSAMSISASSTYAISFWCKAGSGATQTFGMYATGDVTAASQSNLQTCTTAWKRFVYTYTTGVSDTTLRIGISAYTVDSSQVIDLGGVVVTKVTGTGATQNIYGADYFDGSFAGHTWTGTSHNSASYRQAPFWVEKTTDVDAAYQTFGFYIDKDSGEFRSTRAVIRVGDTTSGQFTPGGTIFSSYPLHIVSDFSTLNQFGLIGATMKVENEGTGAAAYFLSAATTEDVVQIDGGSLTTGNALAIYAPQDKATFAANGGNYFKFTGKGTSATRPDYAFGPELFAFGVSTETLNKYYRQIGGGNQKRTNTSSGRTVTWSGTTITRSTGTAFNSGTAIVEGDIVVVSGQSAIVTAVAANTLTTLTSASPAIGAATAMDVGDRQYSPFFSQMEGAGQADHRIATGAYGLNTWYIDSARNPRLAWPARTAGASTCSGTSGTTTITLAGADTNIAVGDWIVPYGHEQRQVVSYSNPTVRVVPSLDSNIAALTSYEIIKHATASAPSMDMTGNSVMQTVYFENTAAGPSASTTETSLFSTVPMLPSGSLLKDLNDRTRANHTGNRTLTLKFAGTMTGNGSSLTLRLKARVRGGSYTTISTNVVGSIPSSTSKHFFFFYEVVSTGVASQIVNFRMFHDGMATDHLMVDSTAVELVFDATSKEVLEDGSLCGTTTSAINFRPDIEFDCTAQWGAGTGTLSCNNKYGTLN